MATLSETAHILSKFPARDPREILRRLVDHRRRLPVERQSASPLLSVCTTDGHCFRGWVLDCNEQNDALLLHAAKNLNAASADVVYLTLSRISAVTVHDSDRIAPILSFGEVARAPGETAPSRLELRRSLQQASEGLRADLGLQLAVTADWDGIPEGEGVQLNLQDLSRVLQHVIREMARDDLGRAAWSALSTLVIRHQSSARLAAAKKERTVVIALDLSRALLPSLERDLSDSLNSIL